MKEEYKIENIKTFELAEIYDASINKKETREILVSFFTKIVEKSRKIFKTWYSRKRVLLTTGMGMTIKKESQYNIIALPKKRIEN